MPFPRRRESIINSFFRTPAYAGVTEAELIRVFLTNRIFLPFKYGKNTWLCCSSKADLVIRPVAFFLQQNRRVLARGHLDQ
jgi:hypothetical protein